MIVYLDQNAIWELAINRKRCPHLERLRYILKKGHHDRLVLCPIPPETIMETIGIESKEDRLSVYQLQCELADVSGQLVAFKSIHKIINEESLAIARGLKLPSSCFELIAWHSVDDDQLARQHWDNIVRAKEAMKNRFTNLCAGMDVSSLNFNDARQGIIKEHAFHVLRQIERLEKCLPPIREDHAHMGYDLACFLQGQRLSQTELTRLKEAIINRKWEAIPVIWYRGLLAAGREVNYRSPTPKQYDVNDEIDIPRMAVAMNSATVCITDRSMAALCHNVNKTMTAMSKKARIDDWEPNAVFAIGDALNAADLIEAALAGPAYESTT